MGRPNRRKPKRKKIDHAPPAGWSQRMSQLKAKALAKVANRAWAVNLRYKSITLLSEALRRDPNNPDILIDLGTACGRQRYYDKAEELLNRALALSPRKASMHRRVAQAYATIDRPERAVECYRRSLELNRDTSVTVPTLLELAGLYERRHQLDDASAVVEEALAREPENENALLQRAILDRRRGSTAQAETTLRALAGDDRRSWPTRSQAGYELGQLLDDAQQYDAAFDALLAAKGLMVRHAATFRQQNQFTLQKNEQLVNSLDKSCYERWQELPPSDKPYRIAALTGHPRSGTTLIEQVLDSHSEVISADEFDVFTQWIHQPIVRKFPFETPLVTVLDNVPPAVRRQARATYWQQTEAIFAETIGERMLLDKNPGMMILLPMVNWAFPEMKLLIALRDPRDVVLSCFMQKVPLTPISCNWLSLASTAQYYTRVMKTWLTVRELTRDWGIAADDRAKEVTAADHSTPDPQPPTSARPWAWLEFRYEDVVADLEREARRILEFLGLPWDERVLQFYEHARQKIVRSPTYRDVTQPVYHKSIGRWQHYARHFEPILPTLEPFIQEFGYAL
jgi:Flp pilus assembly protein TadD